jgi:hypothetical protein
MPTALRIARIVKTIGAWNASGIRTAQRVNIAKITSANGSARSIATAPLERFVRITSAK